MKGASADSDPPMIALRSPVLDDPPPASDVSSDSSTRCGGLLRRAFSAEWREVTRPQMWFIHGRATASQFAGSDFWGTHRNRDWNVLVAVDKSYEVFTAPANSYFAGGWDDDTLAQTVFADNPDAFDKLIELEWDSRFFAPELAPLAGDETLALGRWVFDCGHESASKSDPLTSIGYRAEIHAPEILVSGHILPSDPATLHAQFRIFADSRGGPLDTVLVFFFLQSVWGSHKNPLGGQNYSVALRPPGDGWKISSCHATQGAPSGGKPQRIDSVVQSQDGKSLAWVLSAESFNARAPIESSTIIDVIWVQDSSSSGGATRCE